MKEEPQPWLAFLDEKERAEFNALQDSSMKWHKRGLNELQVAQEYLAMPNPTGEREATFRRLHAAVNTEKQLRAKATRRRNRAMAGSSPPKPST